MYNAWPALLTASVEVGIAAWILRGTTDRGLRYHLAALLVLLAGYQVLETFVCAMPTEGRLPRLAFAWIVWLPPVGVSLLVRLARPMAAWPRQLSQAYLAMAGMWTAALLAIPGTIHLTVCDTVFARYHSDPGLVYVAYGLFYDVGLAAIVFGGLRAVAVCTDPLRRTLMADFVTGNLAFILSALCAMLAMPQADGVAPSVLCHLALFLAVAIGVMGTRLTPDGVRRTVGQVVV